MELRQLWLSDFRSYPSVDVEFASGLTAIVGPNGVGKTNLLEAVGYLAQLESFRKVDASTLVSVGAQRGIVRGEGRSVVGRDLLIEAEIRQQGRGRVQVNRQKLVRGSDLLEVARVTIFAPDDLSIVKGSPGVRRDFLDRSMVNLWPRTDVTRRELARVLKQRNALLRQSRGRPDSAALTTLDVWDDRLASTGEAMGAARTQLVQDATPFVEQAYRTLSASEAQIELRYEPRWLEVGLHDALVGSRDEDLRRGVSTVGPHRDELEVRLNDMPSRTHASQGEQRSLALALRLGVHLLVTESIGTAPLLLLDDVFSELDPARSRALFDTLPAGQAILTTAAVLPDGATPDLIIDVEPGVVKPRT